MQRTYVYSLLNRYFMLMQAVIEAGLIEPLVNLLQNAEFDIKKEAAWAISNATSGGTHEQIKYVSSFFISLLFHMLLLFSCQ